MDIQIDLEEDSLHKNQQQILQQQQNFSHHLELKNLNKSEEISCWSETQNSLFNRQHDHSQIESFTNNVTFKTKENQITFTEDMSDLKQTKNEEISLNVEPYYSTHNKDEGQKKKSLILKVSNLRSNSLNSQNQIRNNQVDKSQNCNKDISHSLQNIELIKQNFRLPVNNNNNNSKATLMNLGLMLKIKLRFQYFFRAYTLIGRNKSIKNKIKKYINDKSCFFENNDQINSRQIWIRGLLLILFLQQSHWIEEGTDIKQDWWLVYFQSLYWALTLMTTGSNVATTTLQIIFTTSTMIFTTIAFGYLLNVVGFILETIDKQSEQKRSDINILNEYMRKKNISKSLQQQINLNLEYYYNRNIKQIHQDSLSILDKIPSDLKSALNKEFNYKIISKISVIKDNFSQKTIDQLCQVAKEEYYLPNQIICDGYQTLENSLICIVSGQVEVNKINININKEIYGNKIISSQIQKGNTCCEIDFFTGVNQNNFIKSTEYTQILRISRSDFISIVRENTKEFQIFCQIRDRIQIYEQYSSLDIKCEICSYNTHLMLDCPMAHFQKNFVITKIGFTKSQNQIRKKSDRKNAIKRKFQVVNQNDIQYSIFQEKAEIEDYQLKVLSNYLSQQNKENSNSESEQSQDSLKQKTNDYIFIYSILEEDQKELEPQKRKKSNSMTSYNNTTSKIQEKNKRKRCSITSQLEESQAEDSLEIIQSDSDKYIQFRDKNKQFQYVARRRTEISQEDPKSEQNLKLIETEKPINQRNYKKSYTNQLSSQSNFQQLVQIDSEELAQRNQKKHEITLKQYSHDLTYKQISSLQSNFKNSQNYKSQQISYHKMMTERDQQYYWNFDKLQDYNNYFKNGNSGLRIQKYQRFQMKMLKKTKKTNNKYS
ncbi:cyclic nucleotide-binding domain protein (macronuclear) [Tetrahymena thermophila SB210]|uniref:Cyclic nucleotide-binding domain protein n=1 Tax=Tetrahymena thermophila (strain SB210) TaxID=312017 RepID=Q23G16_TETTS|nr:cyclic nucleotide-binding domain protein [Tetrahymena thermophila SB210]EAR95444.2 cyclic nucleotide-binding domain protein [Tetrahymena thermophila SB210]|eukprot:XP_001015689.2 cyclic nucleotide-binding domain protein [Tetrahymena thermophila SB210]